MDLNIILAIVSSIFASSGFWAYVQHRTSKKNVSTRMLIGLGHDRIIFLGLHYIERGWITQDEFENLHDFLYIPYKEMGGNGSVSRIIEEVKKLPLRKFDMEESEGILYNSVNKGKG